eukprot:4859710-Prymnesium_polylepis.1
MECIAAAEISLRTRWCGMPDEQRGAHRTGEHTSAAMQSAALRPQQAHRTSHSHVPASRRVMQAHAKNGRAAMHKSETTSTRGRPDAWVHR